ncbi:probable phospholipid-transporting ATPase IA [Selaginella moellendorffii]|uniref:probable phospholipid-transporting ATPase IA n=1 Tax=Selaginella moellendorffii TaxID=88036 RepID=UPI000D1C273D|nr:probable phospholipid-transporting ATPase IA [Selaginella moellendorffii]|eukprot:XP_024528142.1 probable phospholipid-transporting ATPase IA [Selaginella moellendorffii]
MMQRRKKKRLRVIHVHTTESSRANALDSKEFCSNRIVTSKYTLTSFLPRVLYRQFSRASNLYFLLIAVLELIPGLSASSWITTIVPFLFLLCLHATNEGIEDVKQHHSDNQINSRTSEVLVGDVFVPAEWSDIIVGDVIRVRNNCEFPADIVLLFSSDLQGIAHEETASLDGETFLKLKNAFYRSRSSNPEDDDMSLLALTALKIKCELPNNRLYEFDGAISLQGQGLMALDDSQLLLRGATLRNTHWIIGAVVYTGEDTKCMLNTIPSRTKISQLEYNLNFLVMIMFVIQVAICIGLAVGEAMWLKKQSNPYYLKERSQSNLGRVIGQIFRFIALLNQLIPISLYITLELVKVVQCYFIQKDIHMYHEQSDNPAQTRTMNLVEELGQVDYVLSDKTGTLTQNVMAFVRCSIGGVIYGDSIDEDEPVTDPRQAIHTVARDYNLQEALHQENHHGLQCRLFFLHLAICHQAVPEGDSGSGGIIYQAASPDEEALVNGAAVCGYRLLDRTPNEIVVSCEDTGFEKQTVLAVLEFTSDRKRMSIICKDSSGRIKLFCKGADTVVMKRLSKNQDASIETTVEHLEKFACSGYRTLCIAQRELDHSEYDHWAARFLAASVALDEREEKLALLADSIERELVLLGVTAVEDKLQDGVSETVTLLAHSGIKIWVLTGDKLETAVSIGLTSNLLVESIHMFLLSEKCCKSIPQMLTNMLEEAQKNAQAVDSTYMAVVIEGDSLAVALEEDNKLVFLELCQLCRTVICCRVSPIQKAKVVKILREHGAVTLAIGDGANDMAMLQEADIGVGICGRQVMTAVYASNYAIAQFRYLARLLLVHGRWSYKRNRDSIMYAFYKNIVYVAGNCYIAFYSGYSGQPLYNIFLISTYNLFWTSLPTIAYAILNKDICETTILNNPQLYHETQKDRTWKFFRSFCLWFIAALWHSLIVFFYPSSGIPLGKGRRGGLANIGTTSYSMAVFIVNIKLATRMNFFPWVSHAVLWGVSIGLWLLFAFVLSFFWRRWQAFAELSGIGSELVGSVKFWFVLLLGCGTALLPDMIMSVFRRHFFPRDHEIIQEMEHGWRSGVLKKASRRVVEQVTRSLTVRAVSLPQAIMQQVEQARQLSHNRTVKLESSMESEPPPRRITWRDVLSEKEIEDIDIPETLNRYGKRRSSGFQVVRKFSDDEGEDQD